MSEVSRHRPYHPFVAREAHRSQAEAGEADIPPEAFTWNAFISYAHEDLDAANWLYTLLEGHPVPGKASRQIFLDREHLTTTGALPEKLREALEQSRHLVVLASRHSAKSDWVTQEIDHFVATHGWACVHLCRVGIADDDEVPPPYLDQYPDETGRPHIPDLRGDWKRRARRLERARRERAMPVLASVIDLPSPAPLLRALRSRRRRWIAALVTITVLALSWFVGRIAWSNTEAHAYEASLRALQRDAGSQRLNDSPVFEGIRILVALARRDEADRIARFLSEGVLQNLARAQIAADRATPACDQARRLASGVDDVYLRRFPLAPLIIGTRCDDARFLARARPAPENSNAPVERARLLVRAGAIDQAWELARTIPMPARASVDAAIALEAGDEAGLAAVTLPDTCSDDYDQVITLARLVADIDAAGMIRHARALTIHAAQCLAQVDIRDGSHWNDFAAMATALAGIGEPAAARQYLEQLEGAHGRRIGRGPDFAIGWASRGLALARLGDLPGADESFRTATAEVFAPIEASRTWGEVSGVAAVFSIAGRWRDAFILVERTPDVYGRSLARMRLLAQWLRARRDHEQWSRWATTLDTVFLLD